VVFVVVLSKLTQYNLIQENVIVGAFFYYFIGLIISRIGSLIIEPILKKTSFVIFADYSNFVKASKVDSKIEVLSEVNNMYRTICSLMLLEIIFVAYEKVASFLSLSQRFGPISLLFALFFLFLFSYKKQTSYITKRIEPNDVTNQNNG
jgi:Mn2+/Fe2+ NRAMP family transporter